MKHSQTLPIMMMLLAAPALAEDTRELDAHEHGVGELNIAIDGGMIAMEFHAPGADIVGFEHPAESAEDRAKIETALGVLSKPLDLFMVPASAGCSVTEAAVELEGEEEHGDHDHDDHDDHAEKHDDHDGHDDHAEKHDDHDDHAHDDHDHKDHDDHASEEAGHTEFHAEYALTCANPGAVSEITFAYFDTFENARELEVQIVTPAGAQAFEVERDGAKLDLRGLF